jgi:hypothetical protein
VLSKHYRTFFKYSPKAKLAVTDGGIAGVAKGCYMDQKQKKIISDKNVITGERQIIVLGNCIP